MIINVRPPGHFGSMADAEAWCEAVYQALRKPPFATVPDGTYNFETGAVSGKVKTMVIKQGVVTEITLEP